MNYYVVTWPSDSDAWQPPVYIRESLENALLEAYPELEHEDHVTIRIPLKCTS